MQYSFFIIIGFWKIITIATISAITMYGNEAPYILPMDFSYVPMFIKTTDNATHETDTQQDKIRLDNGFFS